MNKALMTYLETGMMDQLRAMQQAGAVPMPAPESQEGGNRKYVGPVAAGYDAKREQSPKWQEEQKIVETMLSDVPSGSWVLDVPVGTGRFIPFYEANGILVRGLDISSDMLSLAAQKVTKPQAVALSVGDVRHTGLWDKCNYVSVMCRLSRWLEPADFITALQELIRVTNNRIIFTARVRNHPHARGYDLINTALKGSGWGIAKDEGLASDDDYRVIMLEPKA